MAEWRNWAGNVTATPSERTMVRDTEHLQQLCSDATRDGRKVKAAGSGHSFTTVAQPVDIQLRMDRLSGIVSVDEQTKRVWVRSGTPLHVLNPELERRGLAMANLGDIDRQTISGAVSTSTHGTGLHWPGLAAQVVGVELVLADGTLRRITDADDPQLLPAIPVGLGALGVVTAYQVQCVDAFLLRAVEAPDRLGAVLDSLDSRVDSADHFEFYWFPHTDRVLTKTNTRLPADAPRSPLPRWRVKLDDDLLSNTLFQGINKLTTKIPAIIPAVNQVSARALSARTYADSSYKILASRRDVRFKESEFSVPRAQVPVVLRELQKWLEGHDEVVAFPVEVRFAAADDRWLSTGYGRESGYIAIHQFHERSHDRYFDAFWSLMSDVGARPHWGKMHRLGAADLRPRYERFDDFVALRDEWDPTRTFGNPYLEQILGGTTPS